MNRGNLRIYLLITVLVFTFLRHSKGQNVLEGSNSGENKNYSITWVSQYPASAERRELKESGNQILQNESVKGQIKKQTKNKKWFSDLILGKKVSGLIKPMSVLAVSPDTFWIADQGHGSIFQVYNKVGEITQFRNKNYEDIPSIVGSCFMTSEKILFTDSRLNKIFMHSPGKRDLDVFNKSVLLEQPTGIAYSSVNKEVWVVETKAHRISVLDEKGKLVKHIGERGLEPGQFNFPTFIWIDKFGTVYVVDAMNFRIQIFDKTGKFITSFGEIGDSSGYFTRPKGIATDSFGHIYVADAMFHVIQVFDRNGELLYVLGSQGEEKEQFWMPAGIYIDSNNYIYIADSYNSRVQVFQLTSVN